ncbi:hypothetical protein BDV29DRAFT_151898 [Aspergillus leporis]|uniref:Isopenicillin N synthase-like Fe(2+) 2OG dioxygenase domain-containing protein n=1 Tax=Aspergillus leporis TaxID=41062 RepID=A0A5N5XGG9_9EURO|nr:hypothetical protein BDV29DRAFT_151898 [Aspergillus leporis]
MPGLEDWRYIAPKPGHTIVYVGDSLTALSKGALRPCLHQVVPPPDAWDQTKFSLVSEYDTVFTASDGKEWRSLDWHNWKFTVLRATHLVRSQDSVLTGRHGFIGLGNTSSMTKS